ncbi:MAG: hypothetical protein AAGH60_11010 [Pseudomonadota bacterium]
MFNLVLHTALLILAAFIFGAIIGCLFRRFFASGSTYGSEARSTPAETAAAAATATVAAKTAAPAAAAPVDPAPVASEPVEPEPEPVKAAAEEPAESEAEASRPTALDGPRGGKKDNLQRIKGVGKVLEGKLNGLGIWHFDQIAAWGDEEVEWVNSHLSFSGRIQREEWIKQASALAAGEETEFSKRVDKGEVSTSKKK